MKKVLLSIAVVAIVLTLGLGAVACSNVNQINFISVVARDYEHYTYTIYEKTGDSEDAMTAVGTFEYTFKRLVATSENGVVKYTLNGQAYELSSGGVIKTKLNITSGQYAGENATAEVLFQNAYAPIASTKTYNAMLNGETDGTRSYTSNIDYTDKKKVSITVNGETKTFKKVSYTYDNDTLYSLARGSDISRSSYSLSVAGVDNLEGNTRTVTMGKLTSAVSMKVACMSEEPLETTCVALTAAAKYGTGTTNYVYFVPSYRHTEGGSNYDLNKVPVRMDEGKYVYLLNSISTVEA